MIDKVLVQSIMRLRDRHLIFQGAAAMRNIPMDRIIFTDGYDNHDFNNDMQMIATAAEQDGYPWVKEYARGVVTDVTQQTAATVCQAWNFGKNLQWMIDTNQTCLFLWDDKMITVNWHVINEVVRHLSNIRDTELHAIQLAIRGHENDIGLEPLTETERKNLSHLYFNAIMYDTDMRKYAQFFFTRGIAGYDESFVLTPKGAEWLLGSIASSTNFYTYVDHFIKAELPYHADKANELGKGVYCPAEIGFKFVKEILPLGTSTDWAPEGTAHYEASREKTDIQYLDLKNHDLIPKTGKDTSASPSESNDLQQTLDSIMEGDTPKKRSTSGNLRSKLEDVLK